MKRIFLLAAVALAVIPANPCNASDWLWTQSIAGIRANAQQKGKKLFLTARIKAALADRKDIRSRYIRVRFDGQNLELAGFIPDLDTAQKIEKIAAKIAEPKAASSSWSVVYDLEEDPYMTKVGEQVSDAVLKTKVFAVLIKARAKGELQDMTLQAVDVRHRKVRIYAISDLRLSIGDLKSASAQTRIEKRLREIDGIVSVRCNVLKTFDEK